MPRRSAAVLAAIALVAPWPSHAAGPARGRGPTIHLDREQGSGYTRPRPDDDGCLGEALAGQPAAAGLEARVSFTVQRDGSLSGFDLEPTAAPAVEEAVRAAFQSCRWHQGLDPDGQPVVVRVTQPVTVRVGAAGPGGRLARSDRASEPGVPPPPVVLDGGHLRLDGDQAAGFRRPVLDDPACLPAALQRQRAAAGLENKVKFAVRRDGTVSHFSFLTPVAPEVERAVVEAFQACSWKPALDPEGEPLAVWVVQPLKVAPPPPPPERQRPLFP